MNTTENRYFGNDGCNQISGKIEQADSENLIFGIGLGTKMACPNMDVPNRFNRALGKVRTYKIAKLRLVLFDENGGEILRFRKVDFWRKTIFFLVSFLVCIFENRYFFLTLFFKNLTMTVQLNFEKTKFKKVISLIEWLKEVGLITSFQIEKTEDQEGDFDISDEEADEILKSLAEAEAGDFITHEEVLKNLKNGEI